MPKWVFARFHINWVDVAASVCKLTIFQNCGRNEINSDDENAAWKLFDRQLCELGQDRWKLVSVASFGGGMERLGLQPGIYGSNAPSLIRPVISKNIKEIIDEWFR